MVTKFTLGKFWVKKILLTSNGGDRVRIMFLATKRVSNVVERGNDAQ